MFGLVVSDNLLLLYVFWELTTVLSFLLVGTNDENAGAAVGRHPGALLVTALGGLAMLVGFVLLGQAAGTYCCPRSLAGPPSGTAVDVGARAGADRRAHQVGARAVPLLAARRDGRAHPGQRLPARRRHGEGRRLPGRPLRPGVRRVGPLAADRARRAAAPTMLVGGWRALREYDLKLILAFGTVSQLGLHDRAGRGRRRTS